MTALAGILLSIAIGVLASLKLDPIPQPNNETTSDPITLTPGERSIVTRRH